MINSRDMYCAIHRPFAKAKKLKETRKTHILLKMEMERKINDGLETN